jgi:hypothetical protein
MSAGGQLDLRALKQTLQIDVLRAKRPGLVRKEVWVHLLGYNLLGGVMAEAAREAGVMPFELSFRGGARGGERLRVGAGDGGAGELEELSRRLRAAVASHRVGGRPGRSEPRMRKRRPKPYPWLQEPRTRARSLCCCLGLHPGERPLTLYCVRRPDRCDRPSCGARQDGVDGLEAIGVTRGAVEFLRLTAPRGRFGRFLSYPARHKSPGR